MAFKDLGLNQTILSTLDKLGYTEPTPIQAQAIPPVLEGLDVMAAAQTGTGKTAGFTLPILHRLIDNPIAKPKGNQVRVLVLTPTRELAAQVAQSVQDYGQDLNVKTVVVFGGVGINPQMQKLRGGADVLIATPGRLLDLHNQGAVKFDQLEVFILDEADRMLDMGFIIDIKKIMKFLPKKRQNLLFSATFSDDIRNLAKGIVNNPVEVSVTPPNSTVDAIKQSLIAVEKADKTMVLVRLMQENDWFQVLVFARTRHGASRLAGKLEKQGINAMAIHGDKSQSQRTRALAQFKDGKLRVLVATDIAARGIDIEQLPQVINFDLPQVAEDYVHRIG
ncbi:MAG TPA: ATP-dependent RNA helicase, partial [Gammaproteobacteria bacterium]|nr:ATP-dependent RNA helicase [Gammaproteobacteria bacterium]